MKEVWSWVRSLGIAVILALFIGIFVIQPFKVEGHSMDPTLHDQQRVIVSKLPHTFSYLPDYGDIVIIDSRVDRERTFKDDLLENPLFGLFQKADNHFLYIKRVIGKPGDVLEFKDHKVYRNGQALDEPYIKETMDFVADGKWVVPANHIFVMGDNRNNSRDSRDIGFIPLDHVLGKSVFEFNFNFF
ncbi:signal peptidase I [Brevibacillus massiliensis]|uniref:signal peptidase I n=1 Tax=Brevibacillus massiliensis TaxID=1118054 RepID=UPI000474ACDD|nr:signal peptidase I [Brevibacillus massiliensis]